MSPVLGAVYLAIPIISGWKPLLHQRGKKEVDKLPTVVRVNKEQIPFSVGKHYQKTKSN